MCYYIILTTEYCILNVQSSACLDYKALHAYSTKYWTITVQSTHCVGYQSATQLFIAESASPVDVGFFFSTFAADFTNVALSPWGSEGITVIGKVAAGETMGVSPHCLQSVSARRNRWSSLRRMRWLVTRYSQFGVRGGSRDSGKKTAFRMRREGGRGKALRLLVGARCTQGDTAQPRSMDDLRVEIH